MSGALSSGTARPGGAGSTVASRNASLRGTTATTRILRTVALFAVSSQIFLYARELSVYAVFAFAFATSTAIGFALGRTRLRGWAVALSSVAAVPALRALVFALLSIARAVKPGAAVDALFAVFDESFLPFVPLWAWATASAAFAARSPRFVAAEAFVDLALLAASSWSQGGRRVTLYPHPSLLAGAGIAALAFALALLYRAAGEREKSGAGKRLARALPLVIPILAILIWLFGRYSENAAASGGGLLKPTLFRFDFSRYLKLESKIELGDGLVLIVRKDERDQNIYLRGQTLSRYDKAGSFFDSVDAGPARDVTRELSSKPASLPSSGWKNRTAIAQDYYVLTLEPGTLIAMNEAVATRALRPWAGSSFSSVYAVSSEVRDESWFGAEYEAPAAEHEPTDAGDGLPRESLKTYLDYGDDERIAALAKELCGPYDTPYDKARAIESYLRDNYFYSLSPGDAPDREKIARFLFETKKGYCSYFAFSMALVLRAAGVPARIAVGFFVDPETAALGFFPVKENMAHAWVEAWMGPYGWIEFDPTSQTPAPGENIEFSNGVDPELFENLLKEILKNKPLPFGEEPEEPDARPSAWSAIERVVELARRYWPLTLALSFALLLGSGKLALAVRVRRAAGKRLVLLSWSRVADAAAVRGFARRHDETAPEFARRVDAACGSSIAPLADEFDRARFSPGVDAVAAAEYGARASSAAKTLRAGAAWFHRVLAFVDPVTPWRKRP